MQNLVEINLTDAKLTAVDGKIDALEQECDFLIDLTPEQRAELNTMGPKSEAFVRQCIVVLEQNTGNLPASFPVAPIAGDLADFDKLRPRVARLIRLREKFDDTLLALSSDLMSNTLEGYGILKVAGQGAGLDDLRAQMSARFKRKKKPTGGGTPPTS